MPKPAADMDDAEYRDFINQLYVSAHEQASLWEVPRGAIDLLPTGDRLHGPWRPEDCASVFVAWYEAGFLSLYREGDLPDAAPLPRDEALRLLGDPALWMQPDDRASNVNLFVPATAPSSADEWLEAVAQAR